MSEKLPSSRKESGIAKAGSPADEYPPIETEPDSAERVGEKLDELRALLASFVETHDLRVLHAAAIRTYEEAKAHVARERAKADLPALVALINYAERQYRAGRISPDAYRQAYSDYCAIQRAIGTLNNGVLLHDRPEG